MTRKMLPPRPFALVRIEEVPVFGSRVGLFAKFVTCMA
jgi:hypothetical protein